MTTERLEELDHIILELELTNTLVENDSIADRLNGIIGDFWKWRDKYYREETNDD